MSRSALGAAALILLLALGFIAGPTVLRRLHPVERIGGGDAGALPRATPEEEGILTTAVEAAADWAGQQGASSLLVSRNGHLLLDRYWRGSDASALLDGGRPLAHTLLALTAGVAVGDGRLDAEAARTALRAKEPSAQFLERATSQSYASYLSSQLWKRLDAGDAQLLRADCCVRARPQDWLRVAELLLDEGRFEGEQIVPAEWVEYILQTQAQPSGSATGPEPFVARAMSFMAGANDSRLWLLPRYRLAILMMRPAGQAPAAVDDTTLPNRIVRGIVEKAAGESGPVPLDQLVPGHASPTAH